MSKNSIAFRFVATAISFKCCDTPGSPERAMTRLPTPRMLKLDPPKFVAVNDTFEALIWRSDGLMTCRSSIASLVRAVTEIGTS